MFVDSSDLNKVYSMFEYSVDMVRMSCEIKVNDFKDIFQLLVNDSNITYKEMNAISAYRHNFFIKDSFEKKLVNKYLKIL